jgi:uncharacterized metal-binding protein
MSDDRSITCARCDVPKGRRACDSVGGAAPRGCPTHEQGEGLAAAAAAYADPAIREFAAHASRQEADGYVDRDTAARAVLTRIEEVCRFADRAGFRRLGLAFCAGLLREAAVLDEILAAHGFDVVSVVCKVGAVPKEELGLGDADKIRPGGFESMCNPIAQAELLNRAGTQLNLMLGLCVGHDALFLRHAAAPCTVVAVKDRVLGHNPLAALYTSSSYYRRLLSGGTSPSTPARSVSGRRSATGQKRSRRRAQARAYAASSRRSPGSA